jgi:hypothetical protein
MRKMNARSRLWKSPRPGSRRDPGDCNAADIPADSLILGAAYRIPYFVAPVSLIAYYIFLLYIIYIYY